MNAYEVVLDYVTTVSVLVYARDEDSAQRKVEKAVATKSGAQRALRHMFDNTLGGVNGGFDIEDVCEVTPAYEEHMKCNCNGFMVL